MSKEQELLPCPFCGGTPVLDGKSDDCRVRCESCGVEGSVHYFDSDDYAQIEAAEAAAVSAWNTRAALASPAAEPVQALTDERIDHLWDTRVGDPTPKYPVNAYDVRLFARAIEAEVRALASPPATKEAKAGTEVLMRATDMLTAYAELVKATGQYAEMHYIPDVEYIVSELRAMTGPLPEGAA